jgi:hypothetical protein
MKFFLCPMSFNIRNSLFDIRYSLFVAFISLTHCRYWLNRQVRRVTNRLPPVCHSTLSVFICIGIITAPLKAAALIKLLIVLCVKAPMP